MRELRRGTVRDLRRDNRAAVLWSLFLSQSRPGRPVPAQPLSRPDLGAVTGLSAASVTNVIRELLDEGIVLETGLADSDGGRPRAMLGMNVEYGYVIGVDVGETRTRIEMFDLTMAERAKAEYPLNALEHNVGVVTGQILSGLDAVLADSGVDPAKILGVGIGVPGIIEQGPEVIVHGQTYGWDAVPLERLLREGGLPPHFDRLFFDNGAKTMGQAELWFGAGRGTRNAIVVLIGSGVGASVISGGSTYRGATSSGAEFGHITVVTGGRRCRCGAYGCLEAYAGAEAILQRYGRPVAAPHPETEQDQEAALAELIAAAGSSPLAAAILEETSQYLGAGLGSLINLFNPERVILGGWAGLLLSDRLFPAIREAARQHSLRHPFAATSIELGQLGPWAVALGAATLPMESFLDGTLRLSWFKMTACWRPAGPSGTAFGELEQRSRVRRTHPGAGLRRPECGAGRLRHDPVRPARVTSHGQRDILILQNRRDNATPWKGALGMRRALGSRAGFVGVDNGGHYVYGTGSTCADQATIAFLVKGTLPAKPVYCSGPRSSLPPPPSARLLPSGTGSKRPHLLGPLGCPVMPRF